MTSDKQLGIGIVGCGMISEVQADAIRKVPGAHVSAFCDPTRERAEARAAQFGGAVYTRVQDLAEDPRVDVVSICTPSGLHMEAAITAAGAGKHVMVEKPLEVTLERLDPIIAACRQHGVKLGAIFPRRFLASSRALKRAIDNGRFGQIVLGSVYIKWFRTQEYYSASNWRGTYRFDGGGALMNQGVHGIDLIQWLMGGVSRVSAFAATRSHSGIEVEDVAVVSLQFHSGALGVIEGTTGAWPGERLRIEINGDRGSVTLEDETITRWQFDHELPEDPEVARLLGNGGALSNGATDPRAIDSEGHRRQFEDFVGAIRDNRKPAIEGSEARPAVAIITAAYRSARERRAVDVDQF
jgi:predicted dehydrogenase